MGLTNITTKYIWKARTRKYYESKGYLFTNYNDEFEVNISDLTFGSHVYVEVKCDGEFCIDSNPYMVKYQTYLKHVKEDGLYYCKKCAHKMFAGEALSKTKFKNTKLSFGMWCEKNERLDILNRWDYDLNEKSPYEVTFSNSKKYWFKCENGVHESEERAINNLTQGSMIDICCKKCKSFAQVNINLLGDDFIEKYWSEKNTLNPWDVSAFSETKVFIKCQSGLHDDYLIKSALFSYGSRCQICYESKGETRVRDILNKYNIPFDTQVKFDDLRGVSGGLLSYDFMTDNIFIEYQGQFHDGTAPQQRKSDYHIQVKNDNIKRNYAKENKIELLEIWYWDYDNIEQILQKYIINKEVNNYAKRFD